MAAYLRADILDEPSECRSCQSQFDDDGCLVWGKGCPDCLPDPGSTNDGCRDNVLPNLREDESDA